MNHFVKGKKLKRNYSSRKALLQNLSEGMIRHGSIETTLVKAKWLRPYFEKLITKAKANDLHARRYLLQKLVKKDVVSKLLDEIAPLFKERNGGYTRIQRVDVREGDRAIVAKISLVEDLKGKKEETKEVKAKKVKEPKVAKAEESKEEDTNAKKSSKKSETKNETVEEVKETKE